MKQPTKKTVGVVWAIAGALAIAKGYLYYNDEKNSLEKDLQQTVAVCGIDANADRILDQNEANQVFDDFLQYNNAVILNETNHELHLVYRGGVEMQAASIDELTYLNGTTGEELSSDDMRNLLADYRTHCRE